MPTISSTVTFTPPVVQAFGSAALQAVTPHSPVPRPDVKTPPAVIEAQLGSGRVHVTVVFVDPDTTAASWVGLHATAFCAGRVTAMPLDTITLASPLTVGT